MLSAAFQFLRDGDVLDMTPIQLWLHTRRQHNAMHNEIFKYSNNFLPYYSYSLSSVQLSDGDAMQLKFSNTHVPFMKTGQCMLQVNVCFLSDPHTHTAVLEAEGLTFEEVTLI